MLSKDRVYNLAKQCLPKLFDLENNDEDYDSNKNDNGHGSSASSSTSNFSFTKKDIRLKQLCRLWGGMGYVYKVDVKVSYADDDDDNKKEGKKMTSTTKQFVIKHVTPPPSNRRSFGDQRKAVSYQVEANF